jgi:hypothetical protein
MTIPATTPATLAEGVHIDQERVLQALNLNPRDPKVQALILVCQTYGLDPLLKHMVLISGNPYITRDGYLAIAHQSGRFDGMEVVDQGETATEWWAKVSVYRKDMARPFSYTGRYPKADAKHMAKFGPEMAIKVAEVAALRRAFNVTGVGASDERWDAPTDTIEVAVVDEEQAHPAVVADLVERLNGIADPEQRRIDKQEFVARFGRPDDLPASQVDEATAWVDEVVAGPANPVSFPGDGEPAPDGVNGTAEGSPPALPEPVEVESFIDPTDSPVIRFHDAVKAAAVMLPSGATESDLRHAVISSATNGETEDWRQAHGEPMETATEALTQVAEGTLVLHRTALGWELRLPRDREAPPPLAELRSLIAKVSGLGEGRTLIRAKRLADENGWPVPGSFDALAEHPDLLAAVVAEVRAEAEGQAA